MDKNYDFSCYVIKYGVESINGLIYLKDFLKDSHNILVPLVWNHQHWKPESVLGSAMLECRKDGIYMYGYLNNPECNELVKQLIIEKEVWISPFVTGVKYKGKNIVGGTIREVSLVIERIDPLDCYRPVLKGER